MINNINTNLFSGYLNRDYLKEEINTLTHKYARETEKEFTMFGIVTQSGSTNENLLSLIEKHRDPNVIKTMKEAIINVVNGMTGIDKTVTGRLQNEYIIDPIAIYYEI